MPPVVRRPHRKSRNGCINCKRRKVKCDEQRPCCASCIRHELECSFLAANNGPSSNSASPAAPSPSVKDAAPSRSATHGLAISELLAPTEIQQSSPNMAHLELLFHYCTSTSYSLSGSDALKIMWQTTVVQIALRNDYLMQCLLSITSFHLAFLKPERQDYYVSQALELHHLALVKGVPALSSIQVENYEAVYLFSMLTFIFSFARPRGPDDALLGRGSGLGEWLVMFRGLRTVVESLDMSELSAGPLGPLILIGTRRHIFHGSVPSHIDHLWALQRFINDSICDKDDRHTYNETIDQLRVSYNVVYNKTSDQYSHELPEATDSFIWLYKLSNHYLKLLGEKTNEALAILAYFCVLLKRHDAIWWVHGWSEHLIAQIHKSLDEEHRLWINWAIREIGWLPPS